MNHRFRILAVANLIAWIVLATSTIGKHTNDKEVTWDTVWFFIAAFTIGLTLAYLAGRESVLEGGAK